MIDLFGPVIHLKWTHAGGVDSRDGLPYAYKSGLYTIARVRYKGEWQFEPSCGKVCLSDLNPAPKSFKEAEAICYAHMEKA